MNCVIVKKQSVNYDMDVVEWCLKQFGKPKRQHYIHNGKRYEIISSVGETSDEGFWNVGANTLTELHIWFDENKKNDMLLFKTTWGGQCLM